MRDLEGQSGVSGQSQFRLQAKAAGDCRSPRRWRADWAGMAMCRHQIFGHTSKCLLRRQTTSQRDIVHLCIAGATQRPTGRDGIHLTISLRKGQQIRANPGKSNLKIYDMRLTIYAPQKCLTRRTQGSQRWESSKASKSDKIQVNPTKSNREKKGVR
jgi:hypothetical protein